MHVGPTLVQLNVFGEFCTISWTYLLKMCKKPIQIDASDFCLGEEGADARFGTFVTHWKQDTRYNASLVFFLLKGAGRSGFISFFVLFYRLTKSFNTYFKNSCQGYNECLFLLSSYVVIGEGVK